MPVAIAAAAVQASIYDVPGGYRAVMFDRFSGVKDKVRGNLVYALQAVSCMTSHEGFS